MSSKLCSRSISGLLYFSTTEVKVSCNQRYILAKLRTSSLFTSHTQFRWITGQNDLSSIVIPVPVTPANNIDGFSVGEELSTKIKKDDILKIINKFNKEPEITIQAAENGLDTKLFQRAAVNFRKYCLESKQLPVDLHIVFSDILRNAGHVHDIFPYFLQHAKYIFPHLEYMEELKQISDLRNPPNWYLDARAIAPRKLIFHAGPTNSGKTYSALERFFNAKSGVYCGPLKLLSVEVFNKAKERGIHCDLKTGEEQQFVLAKDTPANHVACTIEMVPTEKKFKYDVAVIDEIQMIKDPQRGWAWTRALLGLVADEIHICGEAAAINLVKDIAMSCGEDLEVRKYDRLTPLTREKKALEDLSNIQPGDCIVCFNKNDIYNVSLELERKGYECAVIYGSLPPGTKLAQAKRFNDPNDPCKILVATDAIGMGLNLSIRRVIFYSITKPIVNEKGEKEIDTLSTSQALQIAGRAGRFNTQFPEGYYTTFKSNDLETLKNIMGKSIDPLDKAGLHPTFEQVESFALYLPHATFSNLIDMFISLCMMDSSSYFMCDTEGFKFLADKIQHIPIHLRARYVFCCAPINIKEHFIVTMFVKFAKQFSQNEPLTVEKLRKMKDVGWPFSPPQNKSDLKHQEAVYDVLDLYLWLSYRYSDIFPDTEDVKRMQSELDDTIEKGVGNIISKAKASEVSDDQEHTVKKANEVKNIEYQKNNSLEDKESYTSGQGKFTSDLLAKGIITREMLINLRKDWEASLENKDADSSCRKSSKIYKRRNKKK